MMKKLIVSLESCFLYKFTSRQIEILDALADGKHFDQVVEIYKKRYGWNSTNVHEELDKIFYELKTNNLFRIIGDLKRLRDWYRLTLFQREIFKNLIKNESRLSTLNNLRKLGYSCSSENLEESISQALSKINCHSRYLKYIAEEFV